MKVYSNSYDYTSLLSAYASQQRTSQSTGTDTSQSKTTQAVDSLMKRLAPPDMGGSLMSLSASGQKVKDSIQRPEPPTEEMKAAMDQIRTDFESIQSADVDSLSSDDAKELLEQLVSDMSALPTSSSASESSTGIDVESLTDDEIKDMLQTIQEQLENGRGTPPPPPPSEGMMWGFDPSQLLGDSDSEDSTVSSLSSTNSSEMAQKLIDLLTESYDSSSENSSDYAAKLKESIAEMLEKQKNSMDDFASTLYSQLDAWSSSTV